MKNSFFASVYENVRKIPHGFVATYGDIAALSGNPRAARGVGWALHVCSDESVPCHRVVNRFGGLSPAFTEGGISEHASRLEAEGIEVINGTVDLKKYRIGFTAV